VLRHQRPAGVTGGRVRWATIPLLGAWLVLGCAHPAEASQVEPAEAAKPAALDAPEAEPAREAEPGAAAAVGAEVTAAAPGPAQPLEKPPRGPFGYSLVASEDGEPLDVEGFLTNDECEACHERQWEEFDGSMHTLAHTDPLYRAAAELARAEVGEEIYTYCAACHSPQGVVTGLIPATPESELPEEATAGILCDVCHQISRLTGPTGPWGEPGNASFVLSPDEDRKFGPPGGDDETTDHVIETREYLDRSEFCAACHTVIHPLNGLRLEHTYQEWKESIYAEKDIHCQDCHMRSVESAVKVAETLEPVTVIGQSEPTGADREIHPHYAAMAEARLQSAAKLQVEPLDSAAAQGTLEFAVIVHNVAAGHHLPTSLVELRQMWVDVQVIAKDGSVLFHSGELEPDGEIPEGTMRFGAVGADAQGKVTHKPWEVAQFVYKRLIPAKGSERDTFRVTLPEGTAGPLRIQARLFYRSASPEALAVLMGDAAFEPRQVEMARAEASVPVR